MFARIGLFARSYGARVTTFRPASTNDLSHITALLLSEGLPASDLTPAHLAHFMVAEMAGAALAGCVGIEIHDRQALLRSLVMSPALRSKGAGRQAVAAIEAHARAHGIESLHLLTTTAADFFARLGYQSIEREHLPSCATRPSFHSCALHLLLACARFCNPLYRIDHA